MMDMQALLSDFLDDLEAITDEELLAELEKAKRDSQNSYLLDGSDNSCLEDTIDVSPVVAVTNPTPLRGETIVFIDTRQSTDSVKTATKVVDRKIPTSTSFSFCSDFRVMVEADLWEKGNNVA